MQQDFESPERVAECCNASFTRSKCVLSDEIKHFPTESFNAVNSLLLEDNFITNQKYMEASLGNRADKD